MKKTLTLILVTGVFLYIQPLSAQTWTSAKRLTWNSGPSESPKIAVDSSDNIHAVWSDFIHSNIDVYYKKSIDGGVTWSSTKRISWTSLNSKNPAIALDSSDSIHVVWQDDTPGSYEIYYRKSVNGGVTWGSAKRLTWNSGDSKNSEIIVDSSDNILIFWDDLTPGNNEIYYKKSTNGGTSWGSIQRLTWNSGNSIYPRTAVDSSNNMYLVWYDTTPGNGEIYFRRSTDGGVSWENVKRLTWNPGNSLFPSITVDTNDNVHIVWYNWTASQWEIYYKKSTNGGASWTTKRLTWNSGGSLYPDITTDMSDNIHVVWHDSTPGISEIYHKRSTNGGTNWTTMRLTWNPGYSIFPDLSIDSDNNIHMIWKDETPGNFEIYYKKGIQ